MSEFFKYLYFFENHQMFILEIRRSDFKNTEDKSELYRWLLIDKDTSAITPLTFLSMDSSGFSQDRFFKQGYLSINSQRAVFIHESSSQQHICDPIPVDEIPDELNSVITAFLKEYDNNNAN